MILYVFYKKSNNKLYAYTDEKEIASEFMHTRRNNYIQVKKRISEEDYCNLQLEKPDNKLIYTTYTYTKDNGKCVSCSILCTYREYNTTINEVYQILAKAVQYVPEYQLLNRQNMELLEDLKFIQIMKCMYNPCKYQTISLYQMDFAGIFINLYGDDLK